MIEKIKSARKVAADFILDCRKSSSDFALMRNNTAGLFPRCMAVFCMQLLGNTDQLVAHRDLMGVALRKDLRAFFDQCQASDPTFEKPFMQALTFTLSALATIDLLKEDPLEDIVVPLLPKDVAAWLRNVGALEGRPQSGNLAMFIAVLLIHARDYLGTNTSQEIETWIDLHLKHMNRFGFWGQDVGMTHLQFQNGYHQYEILEYLDIENSKLAVAKQAVASLADWRGHFAPYPGGGGCFDYDAVFILTAGGGAVAPAIRELLERTAVAILSEQGVDGGFCESRCIRPRTPKNLWHFLRHVISAWSQPRLFGERLRYTVALQHPKHDLIHTHWSLRGRGWGESDLWDTWFRMLALARIDVALNPDSQLKWGFLNYPGLGYHLAAVTKGPEISHF